MMDIGFGRPFLPNFNAIVGSGWGRDRGESHDHQGIDIWAPVGTPITAVADGTVYRSYNELRGAAGKYIAIKHDKGWMSRYMHLSRADVPVGATVKRGQVIGLSGNTGVGSTGPHLHFDLKVQPAMVAFVAQEAGTPVGGFGPNQEGFGVGVPAEPWIPVSSYSARTIAEALTNGIPLEPNRKRPSGVTALVHSIQSGSAAVPVLIGVVAVSGLGLMYLHRRRRHLLPG